MWIIRKVNIESIGFTPHTYNDVDLKKVLEYSKLSPNTAPPIDVLVKGDRYEMVNGHHRLGAAWVRGDKEIIVSFWEL